MFEADDKEWRPKRFMDTPPFFYAKKHAADHGCDLTIPNGVALGNLVMFTRLVEDYSRKIGRPLRLLTAPFKPVVGLVADESPYPFWDNNPYVKEIVNADDIDPVIMDQVVDEQDNYCQFGHILESLCFNYGFRPRALRGSLFLSTAEKRWALEALSSLKRPLICLHPSGSSAPRPGHPWYRDEWLVLLDALKPHASFVQLGKYDTDMMDIGPHPLKVNTTIRQAMALIWASDLFLGFDSGPAHMATALEKPTTVLWECVLKSSLEEDKEGGYAAAMMRRWSYPQNNNVLILGEKNHEVRTVVKNHILGVIRSF